MEEKIRQAVRSALAREGAGAEGVAFTVERPTDATHGDYATNAAMAAAKKLGKNPRELASSLALEIKTALDEDAERVEVAGPGFINITLSKEAVAFQIAEADAKGEEWGRVQEPGVRNQVSGNTSQYFGKRVSIEYSNPNAFKEMHIGHLLGTIVGEALSRLFENAGATVIRDTFGGDVGPNVAKALWGLRLMKITEPIDARIVGMAYIQGSTAYDDPKSTTAKEEIDALNQKIYDVIARKNDTNFSEEYRNVLDLWRRGRAVSMEAFRRIWELLGTRFDYELFDSDVSESGTRIVRDGLAKGVFKESEGAVIYDGEGKGVHTMVFVTSHDTPTYEAKDLGLAFLREEKIPNDKVVIVTGSEQTGRFKTVLAALAEIAPAVAAKTTHVATGFLKLASGKMSSREGNVITAEGLIAEVMRRASEKNPDPLIAKQVAVGAVKFMVLRQSPGADIVFDPEKSLSLAGDSGPYLQYALVRAAKLLAYSSENAGGREEPAEPYAVERVIVHYPEVAARAAKELAPNLLVSYLLELAAAWNSFYASEQVLGSPEEEYKLRVARAFANTMANGLHLLAIPAPEKM